MSGAHPSVSPFDYPLRLQDGRVGVLELTEADYGRASFLDERLLEPARPLVWRDWDEWAPAQTPPGVPFAHFIFHIGHVGSTLLSRLMGEHPSLFSVREPALLREVATGRLRGEVGGLLALFARVWRTEQTALIKATSFVSVLAPEMMARTHGGRAILLSTTPPNYLRAILGGPASRQEAQALGASRRERLGHRLGRPTSTDGEGEMIAMSWLCEALSLYDLVQAQPDRCLWLDFDRLLETPEVSLHLSFTHLGVDPLGMDIAGLVSGPIMRRYAKAPEHAYDAELRRAVLDQAGREQAMEVRRGMDWLQRMHAAHPAVGPVLQRAAVAARPRLAADRRPS